MTRAMPSPFEAGRLCLSGLYPVEVRDAPERV